MYSIYQGPFYKRVAVHSELLHADGNDYSQSSVLYLIILSVMWYWLLYITVCECLAYLI